MKDLSLDDPVTKNPKEMHNELIQNAVKIYISDANFESLKRMGDLTVEYFKRISGKQVMQKKTQPLLPSVAKNIA